MKTALALATAATLGLGAVAATASGPIRAPSPVAPDGASAVAYLATHSNHQSRQIDRADAAVDRWWEVPSQSRAGRNQLRNHRRAVQNVRTGFNALQRDTEGLAGCQVEIVRNARLLLNALNQRDRAMRRGNPVLLGRSERAAGMAIGNFEAAIFKTTFCLFEQGWQFPE